MITVTSTVTGRDSAWQAGGKSLSSGRRRSCQCGNLNSSFKVTVPTVDRDRRRAPPRVSGQGAMTIIMMNMIPPGRAVSESDDLNHLNLPVTQVTRTRKPEAYHSLVV